MKRVFSYRTGISEGVEFEKGSNTKDDDNMFKSSLIERD